jgi:RHS repeat-associated protein
VRTLPMMRAAVVCLAVVATLAAPMFGAEEVRSTQGGTGASAVEKASHIVVLKNGKAEDRPNFAGTKVVFEQGLWVVIDAPAAAIEGLRRNPNVKFVQRIQSPEEALAVHQGRSKAGLGADSLAGGSASVMRIDPDSTPANWSSGLYKYDGAGNITDIGADVYSYDRLGRLVRGTFRAGTSQLTERYTYDDFGNMTNRTGAPGPLAVEWQTNRLAASTGAEYDGAGNLTKWGTNWFHYDPAGMLRENWNPEINFIYDANDERIGTRANGQGSWQWTIRDLNGQVLRRYESRGPVDHTGYWLWVEDTVYRGGALLGAQRMEADGGRLHYHLDHLGTPRQVTNAMGEQLSRHDYSPYGIEATSTLQMQVRNYAPSVRQFTGHERDYISGIWGGNVDYLDYMHARYYSPAMGRFLSVDPVLNIERALKKPQGWNRYAYVENNPINARDPDGKAIDILFDAGFIAHDVLDITSTLIAGDAPSRGQWISLGGNVVGAAIPFATGVGKFARHLDDVNRGVSLASDVGRHPAWLPSFKKVDVDWKHVFSGHMEGGARVTRDKTLFPVNWSEKKVMSAVQEAYTKSTLVKTQGDRVLLEGKSGDQVIRIWYNKKDKLIETAYPHMR